VIDVPRPAAFAGMAGAFTRAFANVDAVFTIAGVPGDPVRAILRQERVADLADDGVGVEGLVHTLAVDADKVPGIASQRDSVTIAGETFGIGNRLDDGRAMARFILDGEI
jgi:hypothetical protein